MQQKLCKFTLSDSIKTQIFLHSRFIRGSFEQNMPYIFLSFAATHKTAKASSGPLKWNNHAKMEQTSWSNLRYRYFEKVSLISLYILRSVAWDVTDLLWIVFEIWIALKIATRYSAQRILGRLSRPVRCKLLCIFDELIKNDYRKKKDCGMCKSLDTLLNHTL